jgi:hypothetical protein
MLGVIVNKIYVSGPYTHGDKLVNVNAAIDMADQLVSNGYIPFVPHLTHFWDLRKPRKYDFWLDYDLKWLRDCDAVIRLPGTSKGADIEVAEAHSFGIPVFHSIEGLLLTLPPVSSLGEYLGPLSISEIE